MAPLGLGVLSVEFKISLLRPAKGESLRCIATVLRGGRTLSFVEAEVFSQEHLQDKLKERLVAKASVTLTLVPRL